MHIQSNHFAHICLHRYRSVSSFTMAIIPVLMYNPVALCFVMYCHDMYWGAVFNVLQEYIRTPHVYCCCMFSARILCNIPYVERYTDLHPEIGSTAWKEYTSYMVNAPFLKIETHSIHIQQKI